MLPPLWGKTLAGLKGEARVLELADRMRRIDCCRPHLLYFECTAALGRGEIEFGQVTPLYRHAMIHAGAIIPRDLPRYHHCPMCEAELDQPALDN